MAVNPAGPTRELVRGVMDQARRIRGALVLVLAPTIGLLALVTLASLIMDVPIERFTQDPLAELQVNPLLGFVSNVGIVLWGAAAGATALAALVLTRNGGPAELVRFFLASAILTTGLAFDDLFQFHEVIGPAWLHLPQRGIYLAYFALVAAYVWRFRRVLLAADYLLFVLSGVLFAASIALDLLPLVIPEEQLGQVFDLLEDGTKLIGIALWLAFFVRTAGSAVAGRPAVASQRGPDAGERSGDRGSGAAG